MKKIGDYVSISVMNEGNFINAEDSYVFAHNDEAYLIWFRRTGLIVWVGEPDELGYEGYSIAWDKCLELNAKDDPPDVDRTIIACSRVSDAPPPAPSTIETCTKCKSPIYLANSTPRSKLDILMCIECINWDDVQLIKEPTEEQIMDIAENIINRKM